MECFELGKNKRGSRSWQVSSICFPHVVLFFLNAWLQGKSQVIFGAGSFSELLV